MGKGGQKKCERVAAGMNARDAATAFDAASYQKREYQALAEQGQMLADLLPSPEAVWADVGCGTGALFEHGPACQRIGVEPQAEMAAVAQQRFAEASIRAGSAEDLPLEDESLDLLSFRLSLHLAKDRSAAFSEAARVLRPGGKMTVFTLDRDAMAQNWMSQAFDRYLDIEQPRFAAHHQLAAEAHTAGLEVEANGLRNEPQSLSRETALAQLEAREFSTLKLMSEQEIQEAKQRVALLPDPIAFSLVWREMVFAKPQA